MSFIRSNRRTIVDWDDLWLEQDQGKALREFTQKLLLNEFSEVDKAAVREVCAFFMNLKKNTRLFQQRADWKSPNSRIRSVMDQVNRADAAIVRFLHSDEKREQAAASVLGRNWSWCFRFPVPSDVLTSNRL